MENSTTSGESSSSSSSTRPVKTTSNHQQHEHQQQRNHHSQHEHHQQQQQFCLAFIISTLKPLKLRRVQTSSLLIMTSNNILKNIDYSSCSDVSKT